jgi:hypothetical protein
MGIGDDGRWGVSQLFAADGFLRQGRRGDAVDTPPWVAEDMMTHFQPDGVVLDPCRGTGVFHKLLPPGSPWCEVTDDGGDFFAWTKPVDWVVGNPPYSLTRPWFRHSYTVADHLLYLVPLRNVFSGFGFLREIHVFGGIREIRLYGTGGMLGFPMGNAIGSLHIQRGHRGPTVFSFYSNTDSTNAL